MAEDLIALAPEARVAHVAASLKAHWQKYGTPVLVVRLAVQRRLTPPVKD